MTTQRRNPQPGTATSPSPSPRSLSLFPRGEYHRGSSTTDSRGPCPIMNSLANHGYIARSGRNITKPELLSALAEIGLAYTARIALCNIAFKVHADEGDPNAPPGSSRLGFRDPGQVNDQGEDVLDLEQVGRAKAMEHDVSLTRQDRELGDPMRLDRGMYERLLTVASANRKEKKEKKSFYLWSLALYRRALHAEHSKSNKQLTFGIPQHTAACLEVSAMQAVFGKGVFSGVPAEYYEAVLGEERLPYREGWTPRRFMLLVEILTFAIFVAVLAWPFWPF
ncbi:peroxidase [Aspergillus ustus]|uniref:Peroxidase n=1 Tax=Aspergillus ustus TaxID=40382 RepID=A0A0C1EFV3_ASPUT|nr:peroxidase [Aspergillus ustus]